jgi:hypothetical protein
MLPPASGYQRVDLAPAPLPEPIEVEFTFVDGPFDGHKNTAIVQCVLSDRITVTMKKDGKKYLYRYAGESTFKYEKEVLI